MEQRLINAVAATMILSVVSVSYAEDIVLHEQVAPRGSVIRLGDMADVPNIEGLDVHALVATPLMPAPAPGTQRFLRKTELRDLLVARGVDLQGWRFTGAEVATISAATPSAAHAPPAPGAAGISDDQTTAELLTTAITEYLRQRTGHALWRVQLDADEDVLAVQRQAVSQVVVSGGKSPWTGRQRFDIAAAAGASAVRAFARIDRMETAVFARRPIERGDFIRRSDVELRPHVGALPAQAVVGVEGVVGKEAVQGIRPDSLIMANQVRSPIIVHRGERVSVRARAQGVSVRTFAVAQQDGSLGDLVTVESLIGKERYAARVSGLRELEILAAGSSASDTAAVNAH
jgi:flagella basal body P-ring formation protein FlgA